MSKIETLNFSLGPVQSFISRSRKTRDFWTGSFLLSFLAGQAMAVVLEEGGSLVLPAVAESKKLITDPLLQMIMDRREGKTTSINGYSNIVATLPNRFRAKVPAGFAPVVCKEAIKENWQMIAEIIWERYLAEQSGQGDLTTEIWERQIDNYWEINWVLSEDAGALDQRKNWRSHLPPVEPGDKCTLFGDLQELSGYLRIHEKEKQDGFWKSIRQQSQAGIFYDLDENERLCSIALIKRLFPHVAREIIKEAPINYPSTPYLAAVNWIAKVVKDKAEKARSFANLASNLPEARGRENPDIFPILKKEVSDHPHAREFASLDGNCFFKAALENSNLWNGRASSSMDTEETRKKLIEKLEDLAAPSSPFYALLLMDGDRLGALLQKHQTDTNLISKSLNMFSQQVQLLVEEGNGITVFAGGDDVLALTPLENALTTAIRLRTAYLEAFAANNISLATISGAIVYAHFATPLTEVYHEGQRLLSEVAKVKTGRDSLAITVWKSVGKVLSWSAPWEIIVDNFLPYIQHFGKATADEEKFKEFSNSFFYNIQYRLALFTTQNIDLSTFSNSVLNALLTAEYVKSRGSDTDHTEAEKTMRQLLELCHHYWRDEEGKICKDKKRLQLESLFLIKFLLEKGVER